MVMAGEPNAGTDKPTADSVNSDGLNLDDGDGSESSKKVSKTQERNNNSRKIHLRDKVFIERKSLITEMYDVPHIRNIHYLFLAFLLALFINQMIYGILYEGRMSLHINAITENFSDGHVAILGWLTIFLPTLLVYPVFQIWTISRNQILNMPMLRISWDGIWLIMLLMYYYKIFDIAGKFSVENQMSLTSSFSLGIEATRLLMKTHAFVRSNAEKVLREENNFKMSSAFHYFEFLFMPTLVYRDAYPRTKSINWRNVLAYTGDLCACVVFMCYLYNMNFEAECTHLKTTPTYEVRDLVWATFRSTVASLGLCMIMFYFLLHAWLNLFAELTRFADRLFYQDWWTSTSYDEYYRKWNIVVHDWLYNYVYKDSYALLANGSTLVPKLLVFLISAIVHEYVLYYTLRMFYPALGFIFFSMAMFLTAFRSPKYWIFNVLFMYGFGFGFSITLNAYITEFCLRQNPCMDQEPRVPFDWMYSRSLFSECSH